MNKIYKVIWSKARQCYIVTSELAKRKSKSRSSSILRLLVAASVALPFLSGNSAFAAGDASKISEDSTASITGADVWAYLNDGRIPNPLNHQSDSARKSASDGWIFGGTIDTPRA